MSVVDRLVRIDASTDQVLTTSLSQGPYSVAVIGDSVWAAGYSKGEGSYLKRIDPATGSVVATIPFPGSAFSLDFSLLAGDDSSVWVGVSEPTGLHLVKIDPQTNTRVAELSVGKPPKGAEREIIDLISGGGSIWALVRDLPSEGEHVLDSYILQVDPAAHRVVNTIDAPHAYAIAFEEGTIWAAVGNFGALRIDASSGATSKVSVPGNFSYPMGADDAGIWFVHLEEGGRASLARLNFQTHEIDVSAALAVNSEYRWPVDASIDLQKGTAWVLNSDGSVFQVDLVS